MTDPQDITPSNDREQAIQRLRKLALLLDESFEIPGTNYKVGLDPLIGLLPVAGDTVMMAVSLFIVWRAWKLGVPKRNLARKVANICVDSFVGSVPIIGDIFDFIYKSNKKNVALIDLDKT